MNAHEIIRAFGVVVLLAAASVRCSKIHERMTVDEITNVFRTIRDKIPELDVAAVRPNRDKRSDENLRKQFAALAREIDSYYSPPDGELAGADTPVWLAFTRPDGTVEYEKMDQGVVGKAVSSFYTNHPDFYWPVAMKPTKRETPSFDGIVGEPHRSLPKRSQEEATFGRNSEVPNASERLEREIREASRTGKRIEASRVKHSYPNTIYPSLLVQTDFKGSRATQDDADYYEEIIYQLAFWNVVALRFRNVDDPKIRIRISGIIIGQDRNATPYLRTHSVNTSELRDEMGKYWYRMSQRKDFPLEAYNVVIAMTDTDALGGHAGTADRSYCTEPSNDKFYANGIIRDNGDFDGIGAATYALGTILGLFPDSMSAAECGRPNSFLMQPTQAPGRVNLDWSPCSLRRFSKLLRKDYMNCYRKPAEFYPPGHPVQTVLPGDILNADKQCQQRGYDSACAPTWDTCRELRCYSRGWNALKKGWWCRKTGSPAEGTVCGAGNMCMNGDCQCPLIENCRF